MTTIIDILVNKEIYPTSYQVQFTQETSKSLNGATYVKDLGDPLWTASYTSKPFKASQLNQWRAKFGRLGGSLNLFYAYPTHNYPQLYPKGVGIPDTTNLTIFAINPNRYRIGLNNPNSIRLSIGDYIQIDDGTYAYNLHQIFNIVSTGAIEVSPPLPSKIVAGNKVNVVKPCCLMRIIPNSFKSDADMNGRGTISFDAVEARA